MMIKRLILLLTIIYLTTIINADETCQLQKSSQNEQKLLDYIRSRLDKKSYTYQNDNYKFYFSICGTPSETLNKTTSIGLVQSRNDNNNQYAIGRINDVDLEGSENTWVRLTYRNGDAYGNACNQSSRKGVIFILCSEEQENDEFKLVEENTNRDDDCSYVFELKTRLICSNKTIIDTDTLKNSNNNNNIDTKNTSKQTGFGVFGIICLVLFSIFSAYLIFGVLFMRLVRNQRGWAQIPHFRFWHRIGNFQADMCDFICRCNGAGEATAQPYESLSGQLSDDENILNV